MPPGNSSIVMKTDAVDGGAHVYRLAKIIEIQKEIERERDKRAGLNEKYRKGVRIINVVDGISDLVVLGSSASAIAVLSTIVAAPVAVALQAVAVGAGVFSTIGRVVNRKLTLKAEKHETDQNASRGKTQHDQRLRFESLRRRLYFRRGIFANSKRTREIQRNERRNQK